MTDRAKSPDPKRGEIWTAAMGEHLLEGEPGLYHPVIVLQNGELRRLPTRVVVAVDSNVKWLDTPSSILLPAGDGGVMHDSRVACHQLFTLDVNRFRRRLGKVSEGTLAEVESAVSYCLKLGV